MGVQHRVSDLPARFVRVAPRLQDLLARHFNRRGAQVVRQKLRGNVKKKKGNGEIKKNKRQKDKRQKRKTTKATKRTTNDVLRCSNTLSRFFFSLSLSRLKWCSRSLSLSLSLHRIYLLYTRVSLVLSPRVSLPPRLRLSLSPSPSRYFLRGKM